MFFLVWENKVSRYELRSIEIHLWNIISTLLPQSFYKVSDNNKTEKGSNKSNKSKVVYRFLVSL